MHIGEKFNIPKVVVEILGTILASAIMAIGIALFLLPNQLSSGGLAGIATLIYYLLNLPMGIAMLIMNIPLFLLSWYKIGKSYFINSIIGTMFLSIFVDIFDKMPPLTTDRFLASIYGGIIIGIGTSILLKVNSSTGGSELISNLIKSFKPNLRLSNAIIIIDIIVIAINVFFFREIEIGLYSAISIYLMGKIIDIIFEGIYFTKLLIIISDKNEEISTKIGNDIKRGTTGIYGKGMYTKEDKLVLLCAASRGDVAKIKNTVRNIDPKSFIIVANAREVLGYGFKVE